MHGLISKNVIGPVNSLRGAFFLTSQKDAVVVDIGGTSTDVGNYDIDMVSIYGVLHALRSSFFVC